MPEHMPVTPANWSPSASLPWDQTQFRRSDLTVMAIALIGCIGLSLIPMRKLTLPTLPSKTMAPPVVILTPPVVETPKPEPKPERKPEAKPEPKPEPKTEPKPLAKVAPKAAEAPKALPRAAAPATPAPKPTPPAQMGSPDKPAVQTVRPAKATTDSGKPAPATSPNPSTLPTQTPVPVSSNPGPSAAELKAAAQQRARAAVRDLGLGSAISGVTSGTSSKSAPVEGRGLLKGGVEGGRPDAKLTTDGGGTGGNGAAKSGVKFGSATDGDATGKGTGSLSGKGTKDLSGSRISDTGSARSGKIEDGGGKGDGGEKAKKGRSDFDRVMNAAKGRLQSAYKRALDDDPSLAGNVTFRVKVSPDGSVISASISSSDLNNPALEAKLLAIVKAQHFDSGSFDTYEGTYKYNFMQS